MSAFLLAIALLAQSSESAPPSPLVDTVSVPASATRLAAEIAIKSAEEELAGLSTRSPLLEKVLDQARSAFSEGRYDDAIGYARRARVSAGRRGREAAKTTAPASPVTAIMYEAIERLLAAENHRMSDARVVTARELVTAAEASLAANNVTQADQLSRRAIMILSTLPLADVRAETTVLLIDPNEATALELLKVPGMTTDMTRNLIWFRRHIGPLRTIEELRYVPGFSREYLPTARAYMRIRNS